jgi:hypothetical protein
MNMGLVAILVILVIYDIYVNAELNIHDAAIVALLSEHPNFLVGEDDDGF